MSTQDELEVSYGVSNDFFRLWLDAGMHYSGAVFEDEGETLEAAQRHKVAWMCDAARVTPSTRVLDLGCGWGGALEFLVRDRGVTDATGITLSPSQHEEAVGRRVPGVVIELTDYARYSPREPFDAVISIEMIQHVASPRHIRRGEHVERYRAFFRRVWEWTRPGSWFSLQVITSARVPRDPAFIRDVAWVTSSLFPGASTPRLEAVIQAANPHWEVREVRTRRVDYGRTTAEWLRRLRANEAAIRARWGDVCFLEYERYLSGCVLAFAQGNHSVAQLALRREDGGDFTRRGPGR